MLKQWQNGRRGQDGWGRWTRRRKWYRDAELVEVEEDDAASTGPLPAPSQATVNITEPDEAMPLSQTQLDGDASTRTPSSPKPDLPPRRASLSQRALSATPPSLSSTAVSHPDDNGEREDEYNYDSTSMLSSSSRSGRFGSVKPSAGMPALRRRATDSSSRRSTGGARRASDAVEEEEAAVLGTSLGLGPGVGEDKAWGVGDEIMMGLE